MTVPLIPDKETLKCLHCGRTFTRTNHRQKFCSIECKKRAQNKRWYERHQEAERQRLKESNNRRRTRLHNEAERSNRKNAVIRAIKSVPDENLGYEVALKRIMKRLDCTKGEAIIEAVIAFAATI